MFNKLIAATLPYMPKKLVWIFSKRYIAGETIEEAINASKELDGIRKNWKAMHLQTMFILNAIEIFLYCLQVF